MLYRKETWTVKEGNVMRLERNDPSIVRWVFNVKLEDNLPHVGYTDFWYYGRLLWLGHIEKVENSSWPSKNQANEVGCSKVRSGPKENMKKSNKKISVIGEIQEKWVFTVE